MLEIKEQTNLEGYQSLLAQLPAVQNLHLTEALDGGKSIGYIAYAYEPERVVIYAVDDGGDLYLCDGLVRSVLFKAELKGLQAAAFQLQDSAMLQKMRQLRFVQNDENTLDNISEIMKSCEKCKSEHRNT